MESEITLEEYLEIVRQEIEEFKEKYQVYFPLKMTEGDWNEQELAFRNFEVL